MKITKTERNAILKRVDTHFVACAAAVGASLAVAPDTQAAIVYSGPLSISIPVTTAGVYLNIVDGVNGITPAAVPGWDLNPWSTSTLQFWANNAASPTDGVIDNFPGGTSAILVDNLPLGTPIDGALGYTFGRNRNTETTGATVFNLNSANNYIGFRFQNEANGNQIQFGWLQVSLGATLNDPARAIVGYAYEDSGAGIPAGVTAVPEAGTLSLLGLAFAGTVAARRIRRGEAKS